MSSWLHSLQLRLIVGFVSVLALSLAGVGTYASYATQHELDQFEEDVASARVARLQSVVADTYGGRPQGPTMALLEPALRNAAELFGWKIAVVNSRGETIAVSHDYDETGRPRADRFFKGARQVTRRPIVIAGQRVGEILFESVQPIPHGLLQSLPFTVDPADLRGTDPLQGIDALATLGSDQVAGGDAPSERDLVEPQFSRLASSFNQSLILAGLAAVGAGILIISFTTRRTLSPVRVLTRAAGALGHGDFSMRVPVKGRDEVGELGRTFNDMATQLEDAEAVRRTMTADVAHELRTPLSNLQGYLEAIKDGLVEPDADTVASLHSQVLHLSRLVEDLRLIAIMEAGALRMEISPGDLGDLADLMVDSFQPRAAERGITLRISRSPGLPEISVDHTRMRQVLANLVENAINYTPDGGAVAVGVTAPKSGASMVLTVTDTGPGIAPDELDHVFDRLYRVDPSRNRATGGAGLGLTIVKQLVEAHGGTVSAESPAHTDGSGSRFTVRLPVHPA